MNRKYIRVGTRVDSRWGEARVTGIELCRPGQKHGIPMEKIWADHKDDSVFDLDNGHWSYGHQLEVK